MIGDTGCCGYNYQDKGPNLFGLFTLSIPMVFLCVMLFLMLSILSILIPKLKNLKKKVHVIIKANLRLIYITPLYPKIRCIFAGRIFSFSPQMSGAIYKSFNLVLYISVWALIVVILNLISF